jgi:putative tricarboxylic transport membrane protein
MNTRNSNIGLGLGVIAFGIMVLVYAIPRFVSSPSNVQALVLAPTFWPTIVAWMMILLGALLAVTQFMATADAAQAESRASDGDPGRGAPAAWLRLAAVAVLMAAMVWATPTLGMVWTSMIAFALFGLIVRSPNPIATIVVALLLPLALYVFFNHVAGVAVPQGELITLP